MARGNAHKLQPKEGRQADSRCGRVAGGESPPGGGQLAGQPRWPSSPRSVLCTSFRGRGSSTATPRWDWCRAASSSSTGEPAQASGAGIGEIVARSWDGVLSANRRGHHHPAVDANASARPAADSSRGRNLDEADGTSIAALADGAENDDGIRRPARRCRGRRLVLGVTPASQNRWASTRAGVTSGGTLHTALLLLRRQSDLPGPQRAQSACSRPNGRWPYLADEHDHDLSDQSEAPMTTSAPYHRRIALNGRVSGRTTSTCSTAGLVGDIADGPDAVDRDSWTWPWSSSARRRRLRRTTPTDNRLLDTADRPPGEPPSSATCSASAGTRPVRAVGRGRGKSSTILSGRGSWNPSTAPRDEVSFPAEAIQRWLRHRTSGSRKGRRTVRGYHALSAPYRGLITLVDDRRPLIVEVNERRLHRVHGEPLQIAPAITNASTSRTISSAHGGIAHQPVVGGDRHPEPQPRPADRTGAARASPRRSARWNSGTSQAEFACPRTSAASCPDARRVRAALLDIVGDANPMAQSVTAPQNASASRGWTAANAPA